MSNNSSVYDSLLDESEKGEGGGGEGRLSSPQTSITDHLQYQDQAISRSLFMKAHLDNKPSDHRSSASSAEGQIESGSSLSDYYDFLTTEDEDDDSSSNIYSSSGGNNSFSFGSHSPSSSLFLISSPPSSPSSKKIDLYNNNFKPPRSSNPSLLPSNNDNNNDDGGVEKKIETNNTSSLSSSSNTRKKKKKKGGKKQHSKHELEDTSDDDEDEDLLHSSDIFSSFNINRVYTDEDDDNNKRGKNGKSMEKFPISSIRTLHLNRKLSYWLTRPYVIKLFCYYFTIAFWINFMTFYIPGIIPYQAGGCTFFYSLWNSFFLIFPAFGSSLTHYHYYYDR